jgi:hypothetical protein
MNLLKVDEKKSLERKPACSKANYLQVKKLGPGCLFDQAGGTNFNAEV